MVLLEEPAGLLVIVSAVVRTARGNALAGDWDKLDRRGCRESPAGRAWHRHMAGTPRTDQIQIKTENIHSRHVGVCEAIGLGSIHHTASHPAVDP